MYAGLDYEVITTCQYEVYTSYEVTDCGKPATHRVWWANDASDKMAVCQEHFEYILKAEKQYPLEDVRGGER